MYVKYFKLKGKPFGLIPEPKFFFNSKTHKRALSCLGYGLGQGQGFVVITGDSGTGKTTLMSALVHMLDQTNIITAKIINTQLQSDEMLRYIVAELDLPFERLSKVSLLKSIETFLEDCRSNGQRIIVIIDEAQNLSDSAIEEVRMLMNLVSGNDPVLQFVLLGQTRLKEQLITDNFEPLRQRIVTFYHLENLDEEETKAYILQRLRTVGWAGDPAFSPGAFIAIYEQTFGIPAKINMLCGKVFQATCLNGSHDISEQDVLNIIREMDNSFLDYEYSGSLVEGVIDALVEKRTQMTTEKPAVTAVAEPDGFKNTVEESLLDEKLIENNPEEIDIYYKEDITLVNVESNIESDNIPLVFEQITIDQALIESQSVQSDKDIDVEIGNWLQQQKDRIRNSSEDKTESDKKINLLLTGVEPVSEDSGSHFKSLPVDELEKTLEDPPY